MRHLQKKKQPICITE
jgi:hypothetical protein